jgi:hypothetical protein
MRIYENRAKTDEELEGNNVTHDSSDWKSQDSISDSNRETTCDHAKTLYMRAQDMLIEISTP